MYRRLSAISGFVFLLFLLPASSLQRSNQRQTVELVVRVTFEDDRTVAQGLRVQILTGSNIPVTEGFTRDQGELRFPAMDPGTYKIRVTSPEIEESISDRSFTITPNEFSHLEFVRVRLKPSDKPASSNQSSVSAASLKIPEKAQKEFDKGVSAMKKQDMTEAEKRFQKAAEIYPQFAMAFNNLGVIAMQGGKFAEGEQLFRQAIQADDHGSAAYLNLGKLLIHQKKANDAEPFLQKANTLDPLNAEALCLMAMLQFQTGQFDMVIASARKVHTMPHEKFAVAHFLAGRALENRKLSSEAVAEYKLYLKEAPNAPSAEQVRASLKALEEQKR
jgi:tetratricopeptide (TPR) repeat protein